MSFDLAKLQRDLASLTLGRIPADSDAYIEEVARSLGMRVMRTIIASWRELMIRRLCPLTVTLLNRSGRLTAELDALAPTAASAWVDEVAVVFLSRLTSDRDPLVAASATFERAAILTRQGVLDGASVVWPCDPEVLIHRLAAGAPLEGIEAGRFETVVMTSDGWDNHR